MLSFEVSLSLKHPSARASILRHALSTITSPVFAEVVVLFRDKDFSSTGYYRCGPPEFCSLLTPTHRGVSKMLREMRGIRDFKLVLCADVWGYLVEPAVRRLKQAVPKNWAKRGSSNLSPQLLVTSSPRGFLPAPGEQWNNEVEDARWMHAWAPQDRRPPGKIRWDSDPCVPMISSCCFACH